MKRPSRVSIVHASFVALASAIALRAAYVQLWQADTWSLKAQQHTTSHVIPAPRGTILDATGTVLVESRPLISLAIAPREVRKNERSRMIRELKRARVPQATIARATDTTRQWVVIPGRFLSAEVAGLLPLRGVHAEPALERVPAPLPGLEGVIGHAAADGAGVDGIESALDSLLRGTAGKSAYVRNGSGKKMLSPGVHGVDAVPGNSVTLTIRFDLQDIAEHALSDAVRSTRARGGDVVVLDPRSGDLLALASRRADPRASTATALTEPVEPGSTLKPFIATALLERKKVSLDEVFDTHDGVLEMDGFTLRDVHKASELTFRQVIEHSSNIGMAQAVKRLTLRETYEALRDFGFGAATGVPFPSEASGKLREPKNWSLSTQTALSRGYEIMTTPVQLALAYGAIANGGELLTPGLVKEIRDPQGKLVYQRERQVVRRVISKGIAETMRNILRLVVDSGTATRADLAMYEVGGKSGTAQITVRGRYVAQYTATFVGLFPADDPQLVVLVKLDSPDGAYYGGQIAAPVMKAVLEAALASRDGVLDRSRLKEKARPIATPITIADADEPHEPNAGEIDIGGTMPIVMTVPRRKAEPVKIVPGPLRPVPDVTGMSIRGAASTLHRAGFRVRVTRGGLRGATVPAAGAGARSGSLVSLQLGQ